MPVLFIFLLKVNAALIIFCLGYYLVLKKLTFYTLNRVYLVTAIVFSSAYPLIDLSGFAKNHQEFAEPIQSILINVKNPAASLIKPLAQPDYWHWASTIFWVGVVLLALRLAFQLLSLYRLNRQSQSATVNNHTVKIINSEAGPFSFWQSIYVNPANHTPDDLRAILKHEQVHVDEWHILDILLAEISTIFYWFNPGVWLMKKAVRENIEFITDRKILQHGADSKSYQYSLLSVGLATHSNTIVNHFNLSTIKKRIIMMNAKRSSRFKLTWYSFLLPVTLLLLSFTVTMTDAARPVTIKLLAAVKPAVGRLTEISLKMAPVKKVQLTAVKAKLSPAKKTDTALKRGFIMKETAKDTNIYYVNGKKGDIRSFDITNVEAMYILKSKEAEEYINQKYDDHTHVVIVITRGSEEGAVLKEKLNRRYGKAVNIVNPRQLNEVTINGYATTVQKLTLKPVTAVSLNGYPVAPQTLTLTPMNAVQGQLTVTPMNEVKVTSYLSPAKKIDTLKLTRTGKLNSVRISGKPAMVKLYRSNENLLLTGRINDSVHEQIRIVTGNALTFTADSAYRKQLKNVLTLNTASGRNYKLSDKVIVIDGKEATEKKLKKLSAADIESISIKYDEETKKQYGEKGQNGVVFITTKK